MIYITISLHSKQLVIYFFSIFIYPCAQYFVTALYTTLTLMFPFSVLFDFLFKHFDR